jgi:hypothetical protein
MIKRRYLTHDFEGEFCYTIFENGDYDYSFEWKDNAGISHERDSFQSEEEAREAARYDIHHHKAV